MIQLSTNPLILFFFSNMYKSCIRYKKLIKMVCTNLDTYVSDVYVLCVHPSRSMRPILGGLGWDRWRSCPVHYSTRGGAFLIVIESRRPPTSRLTDVELWTFQTGCGLCPAPNPLPRTLTSTYKHSLASTYKHSLHVSLSGDVSF